MRLGFKKGILIYLGAILLMSHIIVNNVAAFDFTTNLRLIDSIRGANNVYWRDSNSTTWHHGGFYSYGNNSTYQTSTNFTISNSSGAWAVPGDNFIVVTGQFYATSVYQMETNTAGLFGIGSSQTDCQIIDLETTPLTADNSTGNETITYRSSFTVTCQLTRSVSVGPTINLQLYSVLNSGPGTYGILFTGAYRFVADAYNNNTNQLLTEIKSILDNLETDDAGDTLKQEKQDVQDASDDSETAAENNSENQQTDSIINVLGSFVSALSSLQPTNCNVTLQWPASLGGNMTVNVCQNKDKAGSIISVFGSITLLVFYIPLALKLLSMIYDEIRSFTNG